MAKYRKKPVVIEAFQYDGDLKDRDGSWYVPAWAVEAYEKGVMYYSSESCGAPPCELFIETLEGIHHVSIGDYVIQGVNGELYPCKPDIFEKTYESIKIGRAKMNTVQVTLSLYYEIVGVDLYGGPESTGYAMVAFDFDTENLGSVNLPVMAEEWKAGFAKTCKVPVENITLISRCEYEDNTADLEGPDGVTEF